MSERISKRSGAFEQSKQVRGVSKRTNGQASGQVPQSGFLVILVYSTEAEEEGKEEEAKEQAEISKGRMITKKGSHQKKAYMRAK